MELSTEDKERIEQEAGVFRYDSIGFRAFKKGAEYATIYEREQQAKEIERLNRLLVIKENKNDLDWLNALAEVNSELFNEKEALEAERTDLLAKVSLLETLLESEKVIHSNWKKEYEKAVAKVSEQETQLDNLIKENAHLAQFLELSEKLKKQVSEQSQRIQQLEGLLKHIHNSGYLSTKQRERIKAALNR